MDSRRGFLGKILGGVGAVKMEALAQKKDGTRERHDKMRDIADKAMGFDKFEEDNYKEYIQSSKDSTEEKTIFEKLQDNYYNLRQHVNLLDDYLNDPDQVIKDKASDYMLKLDLNSMKRRNYCKKSGKEYFDFVPPPRNDRPLKD